MTCPYCDGMATAATDKRDITYRKDVFRITAHFYQCAACREEFTTTESDALSMTQVYNQYRERHSIPFPEEIIAIRERYDLPASRMSDVLGLGANGYGNYEKGEIPLPAIGNLIEAARNPVVFADMLQKAKGCFTEKALDKAQRHVAALLRAEAATSSAVSINLYKHPGNLTGFRSPDAAKAGALVAHFIRNGKPAYNDKLKLNKQLFYADFAHYKRHGRSITGLSYRAIKFGPVPCCYDDLYSVLEEQRVIEPTWERHPNGSAHELLTTSHAPDAGIFSAEEWETIEQVTKMFGEMPTWTLVDLSHKERAWKELHEAKEVIGYQEYAFELMGV